MLYVFKFLMQTNRVHWALVAMLSVFFSFCAEANPVVSVHSPLPFPGSAAILAAISAGETPALPGGSERLHPVFILARCD